MRTVCRLTSRFRAIAKSVGRALAVMRLSDQPEYRVAIPAAMSGDYSTARDNLNVLIWRARGENDVQTLGHLLQVLGDVEARTGNEEFGHALHMEAVGLDADSPLPLL